MYKKNFQYAVLISVPVVLLGCKSLDETLGLEDTHTIGNIPVYSATYQVNDSVSNEAIAAELARSFNLKEEPSKMTPISNKTYDVLGWRVKDVQANAISLAYEDGNFFDNKGELHDYYHLNGYGKVAYISISYSQNNGLKTVSVSNESQYSNYSPSSPWALEREPIKLPEPDFFVGVEKRIKGAKMQFPTQKLFTGTITLNNDDETAYANIQRNFRASFLSTNDKTDSEKSGTFNIIDDQSVSFKLYPYKNVSKLKYSFNYEYNFNGRGGSDYDSAYPKRIKALLAKEFNK